MQIHFDTSFGGEVFKFGPQMVVRSFDTPFDALTGVALANCYLFQLASWICTENHYMNRDPIVKARNDLVTLFSCFNLAFDWLVLSHFRYVDPFNQGGGAATNLFQSASAPPVKRASGANPKFFVPSPVSSSVEQQIDASVDNTQDTSTQESPSGSPPSNSFYSPAPQSSMSMQRFASLSHISNQGMNANGSFNVHSRRTASWSGSLNDSLNAQQRAEVKPLGEVLGMSPLARTPMSGGSLGDDLHEVELWMPWDVYS